MKPLAFLFLALSTLAGCRTAPAGKVHAGSVGVSQTGPAAVPAKAEVTAAAVDFPLPAGSKVEFNEKLGVYTATLAAPVVLHAERRTETATAPTAFAPPPPPTPEDHAKGTAALWLRIGIAAGLALGLFGLVEGWHLLAIGGGSAAGACFVALALASIPVWLYVALGVGGALIVAGPALWHLRFKKLVPCAPAT